MNYNEYLTLFKNNEFRKIDKEKLHTKFYYLRTLSKSKTFKKFCNINNVEVSLDGVLSNDKITSEDLKNYINNNFIYKTEEETKAIESELNKMQNFDWGGSMGNNLEKNIINNYVKKIPRYDDIVEAITNSIQKSVYGYTLNSWYNHWSSFLIEEIFNANERITPTLDKVEKIDFFIDTIPYDLKVTYFPEELLKKEMEAELLINYGSKSELTCAKRLARELNITIPGDLNDKALLICINNLLEESFEKKAKEYVRFVKYLKKNIIMKYKENPNKLIKWLYENQGEMRFDAANRFYLVLVDSDNINDSWKLKRNVNVLRREINNKINSFSTDKLNKVDFHWFKDGKDYNCISDLLFIIK